MIFNFFNFIPYTTFTRRTLPLFFLLLPFSPLFWPGTIEPDGEQQTYLVKGPLNNFKANVGVEDSTFWNRRGDGYLSRNGNLFAKLFACCVDTKGRGEGGRKTCNVDNKKKKERKKEKERYTQRTIHREFRVEFLSACIGSRHLGVPFKAENDDIQDRILLCGHGVYIYRAFYRSFFFFFLV